MRIVEIVGPHLDDGFVSVAPSSALMQRLAAAFTPTGQVKAHWNAATLGGEQDDPQPDPNPVRTVPGMTVVPSGSVAGPASAEVVQPVDNTHVEPRSGLARSGDGFKSARTVVPGSALRSPGEWWR